MRRIFLILIPVLSAVPLLAGTVYAEIKFIPQPAGTMIATGTSGDLASVQVASNAAGGNPGNLNLSIQFDKSTSTQGSVTALDQFLVHSTGGGGPPGSDGKQFDILVRTTNTATDKSGNVIFDYTDTTGGGHTPEKPVSDLLIEPTDQNGGAWDGTFIQISLSDTNQTIVNNNSDGRYDKTDSLDVTYTFQNTANGSLPPGLYSVDLLWTIQE